MPRSRRRSSRVRKGSKGSRVGKARLARMSVNNISKYKARSPMLAQVQTDVERHLVPDLANIVAEYATRKEHPNVEYDETAIAYEVGDEKYKVEFEEDAEVKIKRTLVNDLLQSVDDNPAIIEEFSDGRVIYTWAQNGVGYRDGDLPSAISLYPDGHTERKDWTYGNGKLKKTFEYYPDGTIKLQTYFDVDGRLHKDEGPAVIRYREDGTVRQVMYYIHGEYQE